MNRQTIVFIATYNVTIHSYKTTTYIVIPREIMHYNTSLDRYRHSWTYFCDDTPSLMLPKKGHFNLCCTQYTALWEHHWVHRPIM